MTVIKVGSKFFRPEAVSCWYVYTSGAKNTEFLRVICGLESLDFRGEEKDAVAWFLANSITQLLDLPELFKKRHELEEAARAKAPSSQVPLGTSVDLEGLTEEQFREQVRAKLAESMKAAPSEAQVNEVVKQLKTMRMEVIPGGKKK